MAQYDVDINLALKGARELKLFDDRLKQLTAKLEELDRVQNSIGKRNPYSAAGKRVTQFGKEIDEAREIVEFFAQSNRDAAASMDDLLRNQSSFNNFFKQAADVRQAIQAANKADQQTARQQRMRTLGNATSSALLRWFSVTVWSRRCRSGWRTRRSCRWSDWGWLWVCS